MSSFEILSHRLREWSARVKRAEPLTDDEAQALATDLALAAQDHEERLPLDGPEWRAARGHTALLLMRGVLDSERAQWGPRLVAEHGLPAYLAQRAA